MGDGEYSFAAEFQAFLPKKKTRSTRSHVVPGAAADKMGVVVSTHPPLGQVTQLPTGVVTFYAVLETRSTDAAADWQVVLWHTAGRGENAAWSETPLSPVDGQTNQPLWALQAADKDVVRRCYRAELAVSGYFQFTVKFRQQQGPGRSSDWRWVRDEQNMDDGIVVLNARTPRTTWIGSRQPTDVAVKAEDLGDLIKGLNPAFRVTAHMSQCPGTQLWSLTVPVKGANDDDDVSSLTDITVGLPWGDFLRWFALVRIWTPWLAPRQGSTRLDLDLDAVSCAFLSPAGRHLVFLAVSGIGDVLGVFRSDDAGRLVLNVRNDSLDEQTATVLVAVGDDFEVANATVMYHARTLVQPFQATDPAVSGEIQTLQKHFQPQWLENWYDGLGFCTWNALGQNLSEAKILSALDTLAKHDIRIVSLIIDDNWQSLDRSGEGQFQYSWNEFEADADQFPRGLKHTIHQIRKSHAGIQHIAVWHALLGYWGGISPTGALAKQYKTREVERAHPKRRNLPIAGTMTVVAQDDVRRFYDDFYRFLADCGVDGVKTDAQFMMDTWVSASARRQLTTAYQDAWTVATLRHFNYRAISCMSQTPPIIFHSQLPRNLPAVLVRNSDDFFPEIPASHPWHVWTNAHNSLLTQHLNILPDWDMFQTVHDYSGFHAAARCVSGGPIYITDVPGQHDVGLIRQMTGRGTDGKTVIFRPSVVGRAQDPYVGFHDNVLLKVGSYHGGSDGSGLLGIFNVSEQALTEIVPLARVPGVAPVTSETVYVARVHSTGRVTSRPVQADALLTVSLDVRGYDIISAYPLLSFPWEPRPSSTAGAPKLYVANLGLVDKMAAAATVVRTECKQESASGRIEMVASFKALGTAGLYVSELSRMTVQDNFLVTMRGLPIPAHCVAVSRQDAYVLEIDVERAWTETGQDPQRNNEVVLTVYITA